MASFDNKFLKKQFAPTGKLQAVGDRAAPFVAACTKVSKAGDGVAEALIVSGLKGFSYSLPAAQAVTAQADHGASDYEEFYSGFGQYFGEARVSSRAVAAGRASNAGQAAYLRQLTEIMETSVGSFMSIAERKLLGPIGGSIGKISDHDVSATDGQILLTNAGDAMNFAKGMIVQFSTADGSNGSITARSQLGYVTEVNVEASSGYHVKVTDISGAATDVSSIADADFIFRNGDIASSTDLSDKQIRSYQSWITLTPGGSFNGVNRAADSRLSGFRLTSGQVSGMSVLDRLQLLATTGRSQCTATEAKLFVVGPNTWQQLAQEAQSYGHIEFTENTKIGIKLMTIMTANGPSQVLNSPSCLESDIWLFTQSTLKVYHFDGFPALDDADGNEILRQATAAAYGIRYHAFNCVTVDGKPFLNGRCPSGN